MRKITLFLMCLLAFNQIIAQLPQISPDDYYYVDSAPQYWTTDRTSMNIIVANMENYWEIVERLELIFSEPGDEVLADDEDDNIIINSSWSPSIPKDVLIAGVSVNAGNTKTLKQNKYEENL